LDLVCPDTPPGILRQRILQLQKSADSSGTPKSILRDKINILQKELAQLSVAAGTSQEILNERLGVLNDNPKTPVSAIKEKFNSGVTSPVTPPVFLKDRIKRLEAQLENLEMEHQTLREFTTLEKQCFAENLRQEMDSLKHSLHDYETMYLESAKQNSEVKDENDELRNMVEQLQKDLENNRKELETNKMWNSKSNEQQLLWKKELVSLVIIYEIYKY
jgi:myosin heavy subunit